MRAYRSLAAAGCLAFGFLQLSPSDAAGQVYRGLDELAVTGGVAWTETRRGLPATGATTSVSYGHFVRRHHQAAFRFGITMQEGVAPRYSYIFSYCPHLNPGSRGVGFLTFGFGLAAAPWMDTRKGGHETAIGLSFGVGVKAFINESFAVRVEAAFEPIVAFDFWDNRTSGDRKLRFGISWFFGGQEGAASRATGR